MYFDASMLFTLKAGCFSPKYKCMSYKCLQNDGLALSHCFSASRHKCTCDLVTVFKKYACAN